MSYEAAATGTVITSIVAAAVPVPNHQSRVGDGRFIPTTVRRYLGGGRPYVGPRRYPRRYRGGMRNGTAVRRPAWCPVPTVFAMDVAQVLWTALADHPYALLGPLVLAEGPAATVLAGSLVGAGLAAFWPILLIVVVADVTADSVLYLLGRFGNGPRMTRLLRRLGLTDRRRLRLT